MKKTILFVVGLLATLIGVAQSSGLSVGQSFKQYMRDQFNGNAPSMPAFTVKQDTDGSPYLLTNWANGKVYLTDNTVLDEPDKILNFDKTKNQLIVSKGNNAVLEVDMKTILKVELKDNNETYNIEKWNNQFVISLTKTDSFTLYKSISTKFIPAKYENKGLYENGNKYDKYEDKIVFIMVNNKTNKAMEISDFNRKEFKKVEEAYPAAKDYIRNKYTGGIDKDEFMRGLVVVLDKHIS